MFVITKSKGFALIFRDQEDLETVIQHLQTLLEEKTKRRTNYLQWPAKYIVVDDRIPKKEAMEELDVGVV